MGLNICFQLLWLEGVVELLKLLQEVEMELLLLDYLQKKNCSKV